MYVAMPQPDPKQPPIPGIDYDLLLTRLGDAALSREVLVRFAETQRHAAEGLDDLAADDPHAARARAHELKGMLGNIAAEPLRGLAGAVETALLADDPVGVAAPAAQLRDALPRLCDAILAALPPAPAGAAGQGPDLDPPALTRELDRLAGFLRRGRAREAKRLTQELRSARLPAGQHALIEEVAMLVAAYRLHDALTALEAGGRG
jgi:HPt (histidine-containing phosphotransfer) domain-containing protein